MELFQVTSSIENMLSRFSILMSAFPELSSKVQRVCAPGARGMYPQSDAQGKSESRPQPEPHTIVEVVAVPFIFSRSCRPTQIKSNRGTTVSRETTHEVGQENACVVPR